jgi:hypothetical protein
MCGGNVVWCGPPPDLSVPLDEGPSGGDTGDGGDADGGAGTF